MFFWSFLLRIQVTGEHDCLGPFPGWLSGPPMDHNSLAPLPSGKGWLLCCFGVKGAWPSSEGINSVLRFRSVNNETGPLAIVSNLATCPSEEKRPIYNAMVIPRYNPCEPFKQNGCTVTSPGPSHKGCKANHGFPAVKGHGGCSSQVMSGVGWVHTKCCAGEFGHVGHRSILAKPRQPHLRLMVFKSLSQCMTTRYVLVVLKQIHQKY